jgi:hypothetical protein
MKNDINGHVTFRYKLDRNLWHADEDFRRRDAVAMRGGLVLVRMQSIGSARFLAGCARSYARGFR